MLKKLLSAFFSIVLCLGVIIPRSASADVNTAKKIESIIDGQQDFLVMASLGNKDARYFDVEVVEVIGNFDELSDDQKASMEKRFENSINVSGIDSYMYFSDDDDNPRTGDNVLISINHTGGDNYAVKNGVFRVDSAGREQFKFEVPERIKGTAEQNELTALYVYVYTNGHIDDISIKEDGVSYKEDGKEEFSAKADNVGIKLLDEFGDPTHGNNNNYPELTSPGTGETESVQSKWKLVLIIVVGGMVLGVFFVKVVKNFDKRFNK